MARIFETAGALRANASAARHMLINAISSMPVTFFAHNIVTCLKELDASSVKRESSRGEVLVLPCRPWSPNSGPVPEKRRLLTLPGKRLPALRHSQRRVPRCRAVPKTRFVSAEGDVRTRLSLLLAQPAELSDP